MNATGRLSETRRDVQTFVCRLPVVRTLPQYQVKRLAGENVSEMT